jgi:hypothetical protein
VKLFAIEDNTRPRDQTLLNHPSQGDARETILFVSPVRTTPDVSMATCKRDMKIPLALDPKYTNQRTTLPKRQRGFGWAVDTPIHLEVCLWVYALE